MSPHLCPGSAGRPQSFARSGGGLLSLTSACELVYTSVAYSAPIVAVIFTCKRGCQPVTRRAGEPAKSSIAWHASIGGFYARYSSGRVASGLDDYCRTRQRRDHVSLVCPVQRSWRRAQLRLPDLGARHGGTGR